ncbi:MAG: bifunctional diaminohydroxyphosphoribosylaminopyrimidine deaminase/5-amino-6-(5-phosphoribosylamino)uracil reductase RibD [Planctomycetes bacterium]|nr:bifunctional diaminohydroxyphosphoribosylaminopyrimidine deaminase/5-amino-6-(5-phosphoribosylamino)uracil reductase RibD [Planctomycetota bacterium]
MTESLDRQQLAAAASDARRGRGRVEPNPMVGALVVREGVVVGRGHHASHGGAHAEVVALADAGGQSRGATLYVSLEPCSTQGKTPPCTEAIIAAGLAEVVYASVDPNPRHAGAADRRLRDAGIQVRRVACAEADDLLTDFRRYLTGEQPFVLAKWATTLDGRLATGSGDSKWITGEAARRRAHEERARADAILVGVGTVLADDPQLTTRAVEGPSPRPVVIDPWLRMPPEARLLENATRVIVFHRSAADSDKQHAMRSTGAELRPLHLIGEQVDWRSLLAELRGRGVGRLMVEGGGRTLGSLLAARLVDRVQVHLAPRILADADRRVLEGPLPVPAMASALEVEDLESEALAPDFVLSGRLRKLHY